VRGVHERDIDLPPHLLLSSNWYRKEWAAMGQRRLKNIVVVLEWQTQQAAPTTAAGPSSASASAAAASSSSLPAAAVELLSPSSVLPSSTLLSDAQENALRTAFRMFAVEAQAGVPADCISVAQLKLMFREVGEELSEDDLRSLLDIDAGAQHLSFDQFREFVQARSANRSGGSGRHFVAVSLKEAESLRRLIHTQHPLLAPAKDGAHQVSIGLRMLNGALLDRSPTYTPASIGPQTLALQSMRFINSEFFFNDAQLSLLLKALQANKPVKRLAFFENLLRCRRRDRTRHNDTPLNALFHLADEYALLSYRAKVARVRFCLKGLSLSLQDAFVKFDALGDTYLNTTELAFALIEYLRLPLTMSDVSQLMEFANKKADGLLSLDEFTDLLREPEIVSQTLQSEDVAMAAAQQQGQQSPVEIDGEDAADEEDEEMPPASSTLPLKRTVSTTRLTLNPVYEQLYEQEESERKRKADQAEAEAAMARADKAARDLEQQQLAEQQARDWQFIQAQRKAAAAEERWTSVDFATKHCDENAQEHALVEGGMRTHFVCFVLCCLCVCQLWHVHCKERADGFLLCRL
jgi:Ca2+-binding EF-hand superfamily protein